MHKVPSYSSPVKEPRLLGGKIADPRASCRARKYLKKKKEERKKTKDKDTGAILKNLPMAKAGTI